MKTSLIRHFITGLAAVAALALTHQLSGPNTDPASPVPAEQVGTVLAGKQLIAPDQVAEVNAAGAQIVAAVAAKSADEGSYIKPLSVILAALGACLARLLIGYAATFLPAGAGESGSAGGGLSMFIVMGSAAALLFAGSLPSCGVQWDGTGKPTFTLDPVAMAQIIKDWQRVNDAKDANVMIVPSPQGDTIVATKPNGSVITELVNPANVIVP